MTAPDRMYVRKAPTGALASGTMPRRKLLPQPRQSLNRSSAATPPRWPGTNWSKP